MTTTLTAWATNWTHLPPQGKDVAVFAPQARGAGKTFFFTHLAALMRRDMENVDSVVLALSRISAFEPLMKHVKALAETRTIVINFKRNLCTDCVSLDEAVTVAISEHISGEVNKDGDNCPLAKGSLLTEVRKLGLTFETLCKGLLSENLALSILLDDMPELLTNPAYAHWRLIAKEVGAEDMPAEEKAARAGMSLISVLLENVLPLPGMAVSLTGRAPEQTYKLLTTMHCSPLFAEAVLLDAFKHSHICEMLNGQNGSTNVSLRDELGLRSNQEVSELATYVLFHTGGVARLVAALFEFLKTRRLLQTEKRTFEQDIWAVLVPKSGEIYRHIKGHTVYGMQPDWSSQLSGWDREITKASLTKLLKSSIQHKHKLIPSYMRVPVAKTSSGEFTQVAAVDLLSVLGVPFTLDGEELTMQLGAFMTKSLLDESVVDVLAAKQHLAWWGTDLGKQAATAGTIAAVTGAGDVAGRMVTGDILAKIMDNMFI